MPFTPQDFVSKWKRVSSREKQTYQEHFIDLCRLADHQTPNEAVFAGYGWKSDLSDEEILEKLLSLNLESAKETNDCPEQSCINYNYLDSSILS